MPIIRTDKGLQYFADTPPPEQLRVEPAEASKRSFVRAKALLPLLPLAFSGLSWMFVKYTTSDRMQQQQSDDHIALTQMREQLAQLKNEQSGLSAKIDVLLNLNLNKERSK